MSDTNGDDTESTATRYKYTNDLILGALVLGFLGLLTAAALGVIDLTLIPWYAIAALIAYVGIGIVWAFGPEAVKGWNEAKLLVGGEGDA